MSANSRQLQNLYEVCKCPMWYHRGACSSKWLDHDPHSLPCGHTFCKTCVEKSLVQHNGCAMCKAPAWRQDAAEQPSMTSAVSKVRHILRTLGRLHAVAAAGARQLETGIATAGSGSSVVPSPPPAAPLMPLRDDGLTLTPQSPDHRASPASPARGLSPSNHRASPASPARGLSPPSMSTPPSTNALHVGAAANRSASSSATTASSAVLFQSALPRTSGPGGMATPAPAASACGTGTSPGHATNPSPPQPASEDSSLLPYPPQTLVIVGSALTKRDKKALQLVKSLCLAAGWQCSIGKAVQWGVTTHVIVGSNAQDVNSSMLSTSSALAHTDHLARRTLKYCAGVLCGTCILSARWLHSSVAVGAPVPQEDFLIEGDPVARGAPALARAALWGDAESLKPPAQLPTPPPARLLEGIVFLVPGEELRPSRIVDELCGLLQQGGAAVLRVQDGRALLKRGRASDRPQPPAVPLHSCVHISDVKFPAAVQGLPNWVPSVPVYVHGTAAVLDAVSRYSTAGLLQAQDPQAAAQAPVC